MTYRPGMGIASRKLRRFCSKNKSIFPRLGGDAGGRGERLATLVEFVLILWESSTKHVKVYRTVKMMDAKVYIDSEVPMCPPDPAKEVIYTFSPPFFLHAVLYG